MEKQTKKNIYVFIIISCIYVINSLVIRIFYIDDVFFYNSYGGKFDQQHVQEILNIDKQWGFIKYLFTPIGLFIRVSLVVLVFYLGLYLADIKISINELYKVAIWGEFTFLLFTIIRTGLVFNHDFTSFEELGNYAPFHLIPIESINEYPVWIRTPMFIINPIEILYWLVLSFLLSKQLTWSYFRSMLFVVKTYVLGLFIWIIFLVFIKIVLLN